MKDVNFEVKRGEVTGTIGSNGAGKSTLLKILSRNTDPSAGRVIIQGRVGSLFEVGTGFHSELTLRAAETTFITALKLDNADCDASGVFQIGGTVLFELELYSPERIKQPRLEIVVWTPRGERIATLHTAVQQRQDWSFSGFRLRAVWDNVPLNTGG